MVEKKDVTQDIYEERTTTRVSFLGRNYFRLMQGGSIIGAPLGWLFNSLEIYGIFRPYISAIAPWLTIVPFTLIGLVGIFTIVFFSGYTADRIGIFREQQSFLNNENNPEWIMSWEVVKQNRDNIREMTAEVAKMNSELSDIKAFIKDAVKKEN